MQLQTNQHWPQMMSLEVGMQAGESCCCLDNTACLWAAADAGKYSGKFGLGAPLLLVSIKDTLEARTQRWGLLPLWLC